MTTTVHILLIGIGATAFIDGWALLRRRSFGTKLPDYVLVGRWFLGMFRGRFTHDAISRAATMRGEVVIGWLAHYAIGVAFAALLPLLFGVAWIDRPLPLPALVVGLATVAAPFFVMQPAMGYGVAASRTPRPAVARAQSIVNHSLFGVGLYLAAALIELLAPGE